MSCLCYNIHVMYMKNEYNYYISIIKPIEKEYNRMCILYSIFKLKYFKEKKHYYNNLLIYYYRILQKNYKYYQFIEKELNK